MQLVKLVKILKEASIYQPSTSRSRVMVQRDNIRKTAAYTLMAKGADIKSVNSLLGHRSVSTTKIYLVSQMADKRKAVELMPSWTA